MSKSNLNIIKRRDYRMLVLSDEHVGHFAGLTHPDFQGNFIVENIGKHNKLMQLERELWNFFESNIIAINREKPISILINNGDLVDGKGWRSGGTEQITQDMTKQIIMAKKVIETVNAKSVTLLAGTPYHTGESEDWEEIAAREMKCKFENHAFLEINKINFDIKHHTNSSGTPAGRGTAIARDALWSRLWAEAKLIPSPMHYVIRSHTHYFNMIDDGDMIAINTPALQNFGSKYGIKLCKGIPRVGFLLFDIFSNGTVSMRKFFANLPTQIVKPTVFN